MPAYAFRSTGSHSTSGSPGLPAGRVAGDLLILWAEVRLQTETLIAPPTGWTTLASITGLAVMGRICTNDANDAVTAYDFWSGSSNNRCEMSAWSGDVWTGGLGTIVAHSNSSTGTNNHCPSPACTITTANCLVLAYGRKTKTVTGDPITVTDPAQVGTRLDFITTTGSTQWHVNNYNQQTTATSLTADTWTQSTVDSQQYSSLILALKTQPAAAARRPVLEWGFYTPLFTSPLIG